MKQVPIPHVTEGLTLTAFTTAIKILWLQLASGDPYCTWLNVKWKFRKMGHIILLLQEQRNKSSENVVQQQGPYRL
jgi:hypothetical protein